MASLFLTYAAVENDDDPGAALDRATAASDPCCFTSLLYIPNKRNGAAHCPRNSDPCSRLAILNPSEKPIATNAAARKALEGI